MGTQNLDATALAAAPAVPARTLRHVNVSPAQTWNRLRANDCELTVPARSRKGDVYFALPRLFEGVECGSGQDVTDWVESQAADARYVLVPAHTTRPEPVVVALGAAAGDVADTGVMVREGAEVTIVVAAGVGDAAPDAPGGKKDADAADDPSEAGDPAPAAESSAGAAPVSPAPPATSASLLRVIAEDGAVVHLVEVVGVGATQQHVESVGIRAGAGARVDVHQYLLGGGHVAVGLAAELAGTGARIDLSCRYLARDDERLDVSHLVRMRGRRTRADVVESGILDGAAQKTLRATIDLVHGAKGAEGAEAETVLVLGDGVVNKTIPTILCDEDDVAGNHGATIGSVSPEQLAYLCDRGLGQEAAEQLFVRALLEDALIHAPEEHAHAVALARAEAVLGPELAHDFDEGTAGPDDATEGSPA